MKFHQIPFVASPKQESRLIVSIVFLHCTCFFPLYIFVSIKIKAFLSPQNRLGSGKTFSCM